MKILLLSANTGGGHNSAAAAVKSELESRGILCLQRDALAFVSEIHSDIISSGHSYIYRYFPQLFGAGYRFEEKHPPRFIYDQMALGAKRFAEFLSVNPVDAIISTHIFGSMLVTEARAKHNVSTPHYLVTTDYTVYPGSDMVDVNAFFIPAADLTDAYLDIGVSMDRIAVSGIPVSSAFNRLNDKETARRKLHLPLKGKIVLLFSGSIGCGRLDRIAPELEKRLSDDTTLVIICGHNSKLVKRLKETCSERTIIVGYTTRIAVYMAAADLCISKPGGLSVTEMTVSQVPMVLMLSVPGCETRNLDFFVYHQAALGTDDWDEAIELTGVLLRNPDRMASMRENLQNIGYPGGAKVIADTIISDIGC